MLLFMIRPIALFILMYLIQDSGIVLILNDWYFVQKGSKWVMSIKHGPRGKISRRFYASTSVRVNCP
jgi:hypothetical protein